MTTATARWLAGGLLVLTVAALAVSAGFGVATGNLMDAFAFTPLLLAFAVVGAIVASHRPANPIGWLFLVEGLGFALGVATDTYAKYATRAGGPPRRRSPGPPGSARSSASWVSCSRWRSCCSPTGGCRPPGGGWSPG